MRARHVRLAFAIVAGAAISAATAQAASAPPLPKAAGGKTVTQVATGLGTPTAFAFGDGQVFEADGGNSQNGPPNGGVFVLSNGKATRLAGSPQFVAGLAFHKGSLYMSGGSVTGKSSATWTLQKWSGWNGTAFAKKTVLYTAPKTFQGFNGIAFGPNGRLYAGVDVGLLNGNDHGPASTSPDVYDILTFNANGKDMKVYAKGLRQPWQMAFAKGSKNPLVSDLGQDKGAKNPPDFVLRVKSGDNYGFPTCNWMSAAKCQGFTKPFKMFSPHTDIMGMAIIGKTLYMTSFLGTTGKGGEVLSMPVKGGTVKPVVTGIPGPVVGLGTDGKSLYFGLVGQKGPTGTVYSVTP